MSERLNFLLLVGEDTGRCLGCYGDPVARTPRLDRLAAEGCRFDQAFTTYPVCSPARATLVSGQYPMKIGVHHHRSTLFEPPRLFTHELRDAGYHVGWPGKQDFNFKPDADWRDSDADWLAPLAEDRLPDRPWLLYKNFGITHESGVWPPKPDGPPAPPAVTDPAAVPVPPYLPDTPTVRADLTRHYDNLAELDRQVGEVLDALDASGQADRTVVIFLADHGRGLPREKRWCYTAGLHMPLIVRAPGVLEPGSVDERLVSWVDIAPTILRLAGAAIPTRFDGQVAFGPEAGRPREWVFAGRDRMDEQYDHVRACRNRRYHYVRNFHPHLPWSQRNAYGEHCPSMQELRRLHAEGALEGDAAVFMQPRKPAEELFDVQADPHCLHNLADEPAHAEAKRDAAAALDAFLKRVNDLGAVPESELIRRGMVKDHRPELRPRIKPLPEPYRVGIACGVLEMEEAQALAQAEAERA